MFITYKEFEEILEGALINSKEHLVNRQLKTIEIVTRVEYEKYNTRRLGFKQCTIIPFLETSIWQASPELFILYLSKRFMGKEVILINLIDNKL